LSGIKAKASALKLQPRLEDYVAVREIALSLADDILQLSKVISA
jgi:hypothetical protein